MTRTAPHPFRISTSVALMRDGEIEIPSAFLMRVGSIEQSPFLKLFGIQPKVRILYKKDEHGEWINIFSSHKNAYKAQFIYILHGYTCLVLPKSGNPWLITMDYTLKKQVHIAEPSNIMFFRMALSF